MQIPSSLPESQFQQPWGATGNLHSPQVHSESDKQTNLGGTAQDGRNYCKILLASVESK